MISNEAPHVDFFKRFLLRFGIVYIVLFTIPGPFRYLPPLAAFVDRLWSPLLGAVSSLLFGVREDSGAGGGDGLGTYAWIFCIFSLAVVIGLPWAWRASGQRDARHFGALHVYIRYYLATEMFVYGVSKVFALQFDPPGPERWIQTFGGASPLGLMWTFMGYSTLYTFFAGAAEYVAGILLLFRRTATLGALLVAGVMANVVMMNFCYGVPVKILSTHIFLINAVIVAADGRRLVDAFVFQRPTNPQPAREPFSKPWMEKVRKAGKIVYVVLIILPLTLGGAWAMTQVGPLRPRPVLYGAYDVLEMRRGGEIVPLDRDFEQRWRRVGIGKYRKMAIATNDGNSRLFKVDIDPNEKKMTLVEYYQSNENDATSTLTFRDASPDEVILEGQFDRQNVQVRLRLIDESKFLLPSHGFRWTYDYAFIR